MRIRYRLEGLTTDRYTEPMDRYLAELLLSLRGPAGWYEVGGVRVVSAKIVPWADA